MSIKPKDRAARATYRKKVTRVQFDIYPGTESDIKEQLEKVKASGEATAAYLKRLIREDIKKGQP